MYYCDSQYLKLNRFCMLYLLPRNPQHDKLYLFTFYSLIEIQDQNIGGKMTPIIHMYVQIDFY